MLLLHLASFLVCLLAIAFLTLCLASGLLYLAEIIEENTQAAKRFGKQLIHMIMVAHVALYLSDGLPLSLTLLGLGAHVVYLTNFSRAWPMISLSSPSFIASCALVIVDHFAWFFYFADRAAHPVRLPRQPAWHAGLGSPAAPDQLTFLDITTFFTLCVWMVPFFLFLSLSASDNVLPNSLDLSVAPLAAGQPALASRDSGELRKGAPLGALNVQRTSMLKGMLQGCISVLPRGGGGRTSSRPNEGLIAGGSPSGPSSPAFGPVRPLNLGAPSPPPSPAGLSASGRRLSPCGPAGSTTSPRRTFTSQYHKPGPSPSSSLPLPNRSSSTSLHSMYYKPFSSGATVTGPASEVGYMQSVGFEKHGFPGMTASRPGSPILFQ